MASVHAWRLAAAGGTAVALCAGLCDVIASHPLTTSTHPAPPAAPPSAIETLEPSTLAGWIRSERPGLAIVDVRTTDYGARRYGGRKLAGAYHYPVDRMRRDPRPLVDALSAGCSPACSDRHSAEIQPIDTVVFHCQYSEHRGPETARRYVAECARRAGRLAGVGHTDGPMVCTGADAGDGTRAQRVLLLRGGFAGFHHLFAKDEDANVLFEAAKPPRLV